MEGIFYQDWNRDQFWLFWGLPKVIRKPMVCLGNTCPPGRWFNARAPKYTAFLGLCGTGDFMDHSINQFDSKLIPQTQLM